MSKVDIREKIINNAVIYFKANIGFERFFRLLREKYRSIGRIGGIIRLTNLSNTEKEAFSGFLGKNCYKKSISIKPEKFEQALQDTPFSGAGLLEIMNAYFKDQITSKFDEKKEYERSKREFFEEIMKASEPTVAIEWLQHLLESKSGAYRIISSRYDRCKKSLRSDLLSVMAAIDHLPPESSSKERIAVFASRWAGNPHAFDQGSECGKLLIYGIAHIMGEDLPQNAEERALLLYRAGLVGDEVSNFTVCSGLLAHTDGYIHSGWLGFYENHEPLHASVWNLSQLDRVESPQKKVFVVENPTVFSELLQGLRESAPPLVCTFGQVKLASLILLDMLVKEGTKIYYSGDYDPEGLQIADRLKKRYGERLILWRYSKKDYDIAVSSSNINEERLKKLQNLSNESLLALGEKIRKTACAGYQENIIEKLIEDVDKLTKNNYLR